MKTRHITKILDRIEFSRISDSDLNEVSDHIKECQRCRAAFQSARISSILLKEQVSVEPFAPSPFFQAKVLNAWREKQIVQHPIAVFWRWWQASATLVGLMFLTVIGLIAVSLVASTKAANGQEMYSETNLYSTERVILNQKPPRNLTTEQVFEFLDDYK